MIFNTFLISENLIVCVATHTRTHVASIKKMVSVYKTINTLSAGCEFSFFILGNIIYPFKHEFYSFLCMWTKERISLRICKWKFDLKRFDERSNTVMNLWRRFCVETKAPNQSTGGKVEGWDVTYGIILPTATCLPRVWGSDRMIETMVQSNCPLRSITMLKFAPMLYI